MMQLRLRWHGMHPSIMLILSEVAALLCAGAVCA